MQILMLAHFQFPLQVNEIIIHLFIYPMIINKN